MPCVPRRLTGSAFHLSISFRVLARNAEYKAGSKLKTSFCKKQFKYRESSPSSENSSLQGHFVFRRKWNHIFTVLLRMIGKRDL